MSQLVFLIVVVVLMFTALVVGEIVHRRRPPDTEQNGWFTLDLLAGATLTLAVIMCSFMLATSYSAYDAATRDAGTEAGAVAGLYESGALMLNREAAQQIQQDTICYARAIVSDEWERMKTADPAGSPLVETWREQVRGDIRAAEAAGEQGALATVRDAEIARTQSRQVRLVTAETTSPWYLYLLLVVVCASAIFVIAAFTVRGMPRPLRLPIVILLTLMLSATLVIINDLDHPFSGASTISSNYIGNVGSNSAADYERVWGTPVTACDGLGRPTS